MTSTRRGRSTVRRRHEGSPARAARLFAISVLIALVLSPTARSSEPTLDILAFGDWGAGTQAQRSVAAAMKTYVERNGIDLDAVLLLGDNFYMGFEDGIEDDLWKKLFERMYDPKALDAPFYAVLGNHDYDDGRDSVELEYSKRNPESRFEIPDRWYRVDLPEARPLAVLIALDSNRDRLGDERWKEQTRWLERELGRTGDAPWVIAFAHHPLFSDSAHGDDAGLQEDWGPAFRKHEVDFYLAGHDHALEHIQVEGWPTSFVVSGGGGYETYEIEGGGRASFARSEHGFVHLHLTRLSARVAFVDKHGEVLHRFERSPEGRIEAAGGAK